VVVAHSCVLSWWSAAKGCNAPPRYGEYQRRVSLGLCTGDIVIAPTQAMLDSLGEHYSLPDGGRVISNGRNGKQFSPGKKRDCIMAAGRVWDEAKNLAALNAIAPRLPWPIEIAGDSSHDLANVVSLGRLSERELATQLAAASIYALPARYEPFGLSVLEAGLSGCALVLGDIESLREVWGDTAIFVSPNDEDQLAETLTRLIGDEALRTEMSQRALLRAQEFSLERMARGYLEAYSQCATNPSAEVAA
jgi:glycosyltransferase involved in cell wall biosynthesis